MTRKVFIFLALAVAISVIVAISGPLASLVDRLGGGPGAGKGETAGEVTKGDAKEVTGGGQCAKPDKGFKNLKLTRPPKEVPDTAFEGAKGRLVRLQDFLGSGVVLNFWATWCAPCVREMPALDRLHAQVKGDGIRVLAVSEDRKGEPLIRAFYDKNRIQNLDILVDPKGKLLREFGIFALPTTVLVGRDGREVGRVVGIHEWDGPETAVYLRACLGTGLGTGTKQTADR